jgi:hypothetical protein
LPNPMHDATDVAAALQKLRHSVQLVTDSNKAGMEAALVQFARSAPLGPRSLDGDCSQRQAVAKLDTWLHIM